MRGLWRLTWLEIKIYLREPLGAIGSLIPVIVFVLIAKLMPKDALAAKAQALPATGMLSPGTVPVLVSLLIAVSAVLSLVTIIAIYREGGILKRLRATPLRPATILTAHVVTKLLLTAVTIILLLLAGKRYFVFGPGVPVYSFALARVMPFTYVVSLLLGIWRGEGWAAHGGDIIALVITFIAGLAISSKVFRWE